MNITAIIPAVEEPGIGETIRSLLQQTTPPERIIVALNNTSDPDATRGPTLAVGDPRVEVVDHGNCPGRKAEAINKTLATLDRVGLVMVVDADTQLVPTFIETGLAELEDPAVGGVGAVFQGTFPTSYLELCQFMEWTRYAEQIERAGRTFVLSGTAALIRWEALEDIRRRFGHWYSTTTITEDMRIGLELKLTGWELRSPVAMRATTETMPTVKMLFKQRTRWSRGAIANITDLGFNRVTARYWLQQIMLAVSILLMSLLISLTLIAVAMHGLITPQPFWVAVGLIFAVERVVTVWALPWRYRLFAALVIPELLYALILMSAHVAATWQSFRGHAGEWHHLTPTSKEAVHAA